MDNLLNKKLVYLLLVCQLFHCWVFAFSAQNEVPECKACLDNPETCFNETLTNSLTIKSRGVEYIDINFNGNDGDKNASNLERNGKGAVVEISYIVTSTNGDSITVQIENGFGKDQYIIETRDNRVDCSSRKSLKFYKQKERIAIYCNNLYYECNVKYDIAILKLEKEREDIQVPKCSECAASSNESSTCFESVFLPVHSWYYLYYDGPNNGMYLDFLVSSHKKDSMRIEVQSNDGLFYLVSTRRDKVKCSEPQEGVPVRWKSPRIAVYCYNNYIGCKFSIFIRSIPMDTTKNSQIEGIGQDQSKYIKNTDKLSGYSELANPNWSEWSEWSDCMESRNGMGIRTRERKCLYTAIDFVDLKNVTSKYSANEVEGLLTSSDYPYCEGSSTETQNCRLEINEQSYQNLIIFIFIISAMILTFYIERKPRSSQNYDYNDEVVKSNEMINRGDPVGRIQREISISENSPLLNTYFRRYD